MMGSMLRPSRQRVAPFIGTVALLLFAAGNLGCPEPCSQAGCPEDSVCSLATERCLEPSRIYGPPCPQGPSECHRGVCLDMGEADGGPICTGTCEADDPPCPEGFTCQPVNDGRGGTTRVCVPSGAGALGDACAGPADCISGLCLNYKPGPFCSAFCDEDPEVCGEGNVACVTFVDTAENAFDLCVAGGAAGPGEGCPDGIVDCDLTRSDICLASHDNSINFCAPACPNGHEDCSALAGGCCADLGEVGDPDHFFCLPSEYCACQPQCLGRTCGADGCGGLCGLCEEGEICQNGNCVACTPSCGEAECGDDGCGGSCGSCDSGAVCEAGVCVATCIPACDGRFCGPDGCGGNCGLCDSPERCHDGDCVPPALLLVDLVVRDEAASPAPLWGLGDFQTAPSIGPPVVYGQGPQPGTTQVLLCGETLLCQEDTDLVAGIPYTLRLGYDAGAGTVRCDATFAWDAGEAAFITAGGDCLTDEGGPFETVTIEGDLDAAVFGWALPE
jgi:hypothetical protein